MGNIPVPIYCSFGENHTDQAQLVHLIRDRFHQGQVRWRGCLALLLQEGQRLLEYPHHYRHGYWLTIRKSGRRDAGTYRRPENLGTRHGGHQGYRRVRLM